MRKKSAKKKKIIPRSSKSSKIHIAHIKKTRANVATLQKELAPTGIKISLGVRPVFVWALLGAFLTGTLIFFSSGSESKLEESSFSQKLSQVATLSLLSKDDEPITLVATGDILLARFVELQMRQRKDYTYPFHKVADFLNNADITFANLETPFFPGGNTPKDSTTFRADIEGLKGLKFAGFDVLSIANNHSMNYRAPGLLRTLDELSKAKIRTAGGGKNQDKAHTPAILSVKGKKVAFYAYNDHTIPPGFHGEATWNRPGIARMDIESVKNDVKNAIEFADFVVVSMHAGKEYTRQTTKFQRDFAHAAIDAGASLVIGHHPHWVQPVEYYGNGIIFYSLGNFVFDQFFSEDVQSGLAVKVTLQQGEKPAAELFPVKIDKTQPRILAGEERENELRRLGL